jgi:opacity protein-like surface antigen
MVKFFSTVLVAFAVVVFAAPAFAQDAPQFEIFMGYGNINIGDSGRKSGFVSNQTLNLNHWFAIDNMFGAYSLGSDPTVGKVTLLSNIFGAKLTHRAEKIEPYAAVGIGAGWLTTQSGQGNNGIAFRVGGGVDIPFKESFAWKVEVTRVSYRFSGSWNSGTNLSTGIVIRVFE